MVTPAVCGDMDRHQSPRHQLVGHCGGWYVAGSEVRHPEGQRLGSSEEKMIKRQKQDPIMSGQNFFWKSFAGAGVAELAGPNLCNIRDDDRYSTLLYTMHFETINAFSSHTKPR